MQEMNMTVRCGRCLSVYPLSQLQSCAACRNFVCAGCMRRIDYVPARVYGYEVTVSVNLCCACLLAAQQEGRKVWS